MYWWWWYEKVLFRQKNLFLWTFLWVTWCPPLRVKRSKKGQIINMLKWQKWECQCVCLWQTCKSVHGDLFVGPTVRGQKVKERSNYKHAQMTNITVSMYWPWTKIQKCPRWPLRLTYGYGVKGQRKVKLQTCSNDKSNSVNAWVKGHNHCCLNG